MSKLLVGFALGAFTLFTACNNTNNKSVSSNKTGNSSATAIPRVSPLTSPVNGLLRIYLQMKNDFVNDDIVRERQLLVKSW